jgi:hypothetical protein
MLQVTAKKSPAKFAICSGVTGAILTAPKDLRAHIGKKSFERRWERIVEWLYANCGDEYDLTAHSFTPRIPRQTDKAVGALRQVDRKPSTNCAAAIPLCSGAGQRN